MGGSGGGAEAANPPPPRNGKPWPGQVLAGAYMTRVRPSCTIPDPARALRSPQVVMPSQPPAMPPAEMKQAAPNDPEQYLRNQYHISPLAKLPMAPGSGQSDKPVEVLAQYTMTAEGRDRMSACFWDNDVSDQLLKGGTLATFSALGTWCVLSSP